MKATVYTSGAKITYKSTNKKIAEVSSKGKVTGVNKGKATIKATIKYKGKSYTKSCKITVSDKTVVNLPHTPYTVSDKYSSIIIKSVSYKFDTNYLLLSVSGKKTADILQNTCSFAIFTQIVETAFKGK